jgi:hypothetical protein
MRIAIEHKRSKSDVDRSFNKLLQGAAGLPVRVTVQQKSWQGSTLNLSLTAMMGLLSTLIKGTVEVTDTEVIVDADLGFLNQFVPGKTAREVIANRI